MMNNDVSMYAYSHRFQNVNSGVEMLVFVCFITKRDIKL